jgi:3-deoxy-7-phosphoheptulonate synthase
MPELSPQNTSSHAAAATPVGWSPDSWRTKLQAQQVLYADRAKVERVVARLRTLPPLVTSWEIERLKGMIAEAQEGKRFLLQGGDCAERIEDCRPESVTAKLKILLQMSVVLIYAGKKPVIRVGRFAGQYAKPRSSPTETRTVGGREVTLPSYYGDLVNRAGFSEAERTPDPERMLEGYAHAAMTLNFVRALMDGGFADIHHPEYWDLGFMAHAGLPPEIRGEYQEMTRRLAEGLKFMEAIGERSVDQLTRADFFTSHEGLNLLYESAQTRTVPRRSGWYNLSTHLPWLGERTRALDGAHVEYFRGVRNPVGVKIGPATAPAELPALLRALNPGRERGKIVVIARLGARNVRTKLPELVRAVQDAPDAGPVLWACDPMHGNSTTTAGGVKTRSFAEITDELEASWDAHAALGSRLGGVHIELTGEDVTECLGGARGMSEADLSRNYQSPCDPRLNYEQSLELAFALARRMAG